MHQEKKKADGKPNSLFERVIPGENYVYEMATVGEDSKLRIMVKIHPDTNRIECPYFKIYLPNSLTPGKAHNGEGIARLALKSSKNIKHVDREGYQQLAEVTADVIDRVHAFMAKQSKKYSKATNWKATCADWNNETGLIGSDVIGYLAGNYDEQNKDNALYVPSNQQVPESWDRLPS